MTVFEKQYLQKSIVPVMAGLAACAVVVLPLAVKADDAGPAKPDQDISRIEADPRYQLVPSGEDFLRIDRHNGSVSICREVNERWRCMPMPMVEEAYQAEIDELSEEVQRLENRLAQLEPDLGERPGLMGKENKKSNRSDSKDSKDESRFLSKKDEKELDQALDIYEKAMRRFFGIVKEFKNDLGE